MLCEVVVLSIKIVHCGDIHIGFKGGNKIYSSRRRVEVMTTFLKIVEFAKEKQADLFLIAGDLFDSHKISDDVLNQVFEALADFSGTVFISPGNHDYYSENTFWEQIEMPANVKIFKRDEELVLENLGVRIFGNAFEGPYRQTSALSRIFPNDDLINIALLHGDMTGGSSYCPIAENEIKNSGMDYVALGHIHQRSEVLKAGDTYYAYSGCPEGQGFDETGEKGVYFGTVEKGAAELKFIPLCSRQFARESIDISQVSHKNEITEFILRKIKNKYGEKYTDFLYKIALTGESGLNFSASELETALGNELYYVKINDKTRAAIKDLTNLTKDSSIKGLFAAKILDKMECSSDEALENALKLGLRAFSEEVTFNED